MRGRLVERGRASGWRLQRGVRVSGIVPGFPWGICDAVPLGLDAVRRPVLCRHFSVGAAFSGDGRLGWTGQTELARLCCNYIQPLLITQCVGDNEKSRAGRGFVTGKFYAFVTGKFYALVRQRELSDNPILNAFWRVAPSDRFKRRAIDRAGIFLRASDLRSRTWTDVQVRLFDAFFGMHISELLKARRYKPI